MFRKSREYKVQNAQVTTRGVLDAGSKVCQNKYVRRTFDFVGRRLWNALSLDIGAEEKLDLFKNRVKMILFNGTEELKSRAWTYS